MANNNVRQQEEKKNLFTIFEKVLKTKGLFDEGVPVKILPKIIFVAAIMIFYIGNTHYAERTIRKIERLKSQVDDLRADYTTLKAEVMYSSKQSEVARRVEIFGLEESMHAPFKLRIQEDEY